MLLNGRALIFTFSGTQVRIGEIKRLQSLFTMSTSASHTHANLQSVRNLRCKTPDGSLGWSTKECTVIQYIINY